MGRNGSKFVDRRRLSTREGRGSTYLDGDLLARHPPDPPRAIDQVYTDRPTGLLHPLRSRVVAVQIDPFESKL